MCFQSNRSTPIIADSDNASIYESARILNSGGLIAFPTDTVYGVGALFTNKSAVKRLYDTKSRTLNKAIPILVGNFYDIWSLSKEVTPSAQKLAKLFWPGPLSLVVHKSDNVPDIVAPGSTVALRSPNHYWLLELLSLVGPLAVSSANKSGESEAISCNEVQASFGNKLDLIVSGTIIRPSLPSTVVDCSVDPPKIIREGPISSASIKTAM
ncbi:MAG: L-threonylcarbamoyladenylate synthase [Anaerolineales bacterium]|nr:L-threonylcarbamoyladenylate synthase [Anaerolineales bacterium]